MQEREESNVPIDGRLLPAPMTLSLQGEIVILKLALELSFGFFAEGSWGRVTLRAALSLGGEAKTTVNVRIPGGERKWEFETTLHGEIFATAEVRILGWSVSTRLGANSGLKLSGKIYDGSPQAPSAPPASPWKLDFKVKATRGMVTGQFSSFGVTYPWSRELWPETDLVPWGRETS